MNETASAREPVSTPHYNGFWPVFLIGVSFAMILSWEIEVGIYTRRNAEQLREQHLHVVDQAKVVQTNLEKLVRALVELSKTDENALKVVNKFGIKLNDPTVPTATPTP